MYRKFFKRFFDIIVSFTALACLSPILVVVTLWLTIANKGAGAIFTQERPGKDEKIFKIIKFKSMTDERDEEGQLLPDAERLTRAGRFVRATSIDELPQLINVLKGDMSFVGPRPLIPEEKEIRILRKEYGIYSVRPGITGWAQVNGRDMLSDEEKALFDKEYIDKQSISFDIKIMIKTVMVVLKRENIAEGGEPDNRYNSGNS